MTCALQRIARTQAELVAERRWLVTVAMDLRPWYRKPFYFAAWMARWLAGREP